MEPPLYKSSVRLSYMFISNELCTEVGDYLNVYLCMQKEKSLLIPTQLCV
jgi:hypothetical protein